MSERKARGAGDREGGEEGERERGGEGCERMEKDDRAPSSFALKRGGQIILS